MIPSEMRRSVDTSDDDEPPGRAHRGGDPRPGPEEPGDVLALIGSPDHHDVSRPDAGHTRVDPERGFDGRSDVDDRDRSE